MAPLRKSAHLIKLGRTLAASLAVVSAVEASASSALPAMMRSTVDAWMASQSNGLVPYGYDFLADTPLEPDRMSPPNLVRQIDAAFAAARYLEYTGDARLREPIRRSLSAMAERSIPIGKSRLQRVVEATRVLSLPVGRWKLRNALERLGLLYQASGEAKVVSSNGKYDGAITGGVALALVTELVYSRASGDESFAPYRRAWLEGLLSLRIPGGGFRHFPVSIDDTDYDNGEGWLALAVYVDRHRDDRETASALEDVDAVMLARYSEAPTLAFFAWGAMAAVQRFTTTRDPRFLTYLQRQADVFAERWQRSMKPEANHCAPLEGVAAMLPVLTAAGETGSERVRRLRSWSEGELAKLPRLQIQPGQQGMALGGEAYLKAPAMASFAGGFLWNLREPTARVDAAGHCLSAMVMLDRAKLP